MAIDAPDQTSTTTDLSTKTRIQFTGLQLALRSLSFYYKDKTSSFIQEPITGLLDVTLPPEGVDLDITVSLIPTASGTSEREERYGFHRVESVSANLHSLEVSVRESNKQILLSVFQPIFRAGVSSALKNAIETHLRLALESLDRAAYDIHKRAQVFDDAGLPSAGAYIGGLISFVGKKRKEAAADPSPGVFDGLRVTGVGLVKDDPREAKKVAVGAGPQILSGDKHGPIGNFSGQPGSSETSKKVEEGKEQVKGMVSQAKAKAGEAKEKVLDFKDAVKQKREAELEKEGWKTDAFDV